MWISFVRLITPLYSLLRRNAWTDSPSREGHWSLNIERTPLSNLQKAVSLPLSLLIFRKKTRIFSEIGSQWLDGSELYLKHNARWVYTTVIAYIRGRRVSPWDVSWRLESRVWANLQRIEWISGEAATWVDSIRWDLSQWKVSLTQQLRDWRFELNLQLQF